MEDLRIAAVCMHSIPGEIARNLSHMETFIREASERRVDVVCFPEFSLSGYLLESPDRIYSRSDYDDLLREVIRIAGQYGLTIITGVIEISGEGRPYISQILAGPEGIIGIHRKTHLSPPETSKYQAGQKLEVYECGKALLGVQLCYEAHFPEITTVMALKGAEVVFMPHASPQGTPEEKVQSWLRHLTGRAFDNSLFVVACNQVGTGRGPLSFPGVALILNPLGRIIKSYRGKEEKMIVADLAGDELKEVRGHRMKCFLPFRRPELYGKLTEAYPLFAPK
ncbi:MAG: nitrilase-related carbon-nitrogen hydrolase [Pseudomonadota bacterium]